MMHRFSEYLRDNHGHRAYTVSIGVSAAVTFIVLVGWYVNLRYQAVKVASPVEGVSPLSASVVGLKDLSKTIGDDVSLIGSIFNGSNK